MSVNTRRFPTKNASTGSAHLMCLLLSAVKCPAKQQCSIWDSCVAFHHSPGTTSVTALPSKCTRWPSAAQGALRSNNRPSVRLSASPGAALDRIRATYCITFKRLRPFTKSHAGGRRAGRRVACSPVACSPGSSATGVCSGQFGENGGIRCQASIGSCRTAVCLLARTTVGRVLGSKALSNSKLSVCTMLLYA